MQVLIELAPLAAFFVAYRLWGLYSATAVLMVAMVALLLVDLLRERRIPPMHGLAAGLYFVLGTATLLLHNQRFIQWKPTVFLWVLSIAFLGSFWIGERPLAARLLGKVLDEHAQIPPAVWRRLNWLWVVFCAALGALNLLVAFLASERTWVNFKVFGLFIATFAFMVAQALWLSRRAMPTPAEDSAA